MTLLSGPAAAPAAGLALGFKDFISVDMGGTSFDAALVRGGQPAVTTSGTVNRYALALLASDLSSYTTGTIVTIDGGMVNRGSLI